MKQSMFGILLACLLMAAFSLPASAQRLQQPLGRGVVAVNNGSNILVTWRKLAQEPENTTYNVYKRTIGGTAFTKVNSTPITKTNFSTTTSAIPFNNEIAVSTIIDGVESQPSDVFTFKSQAFRSVFMNINFSSTLPSDEYVVKFVWPADLDGDGEYDYVCDRLSTTDVSTRSHKIEGYLRDGTYLWTVDVGPNVYLDLGQDDMCLAYDMNCDGRAEVVIKSSDGTRFWDHDKMTWGKYLLGSTNGDTDKDGIIDYNAQTVKNPPFYITVINGMTGEEMNSIEMPYSKMHDGSDQYSRTNKSSYMGDGYNLLNGHMGVCYLDGIHPSVVMEYLDRTTDGTHHNYVSAWGYDFNGANANDWKEKFTWSRNDKTPWPAEFHSIRIGDVDLDGKDEMIEGGYTLDDNGTMLFSAGIGHGDRFRVSDIDPNRPGLETYAIQQSSLLGQLLYDSSNGKHLKDWYLSSAADVGRGECMDVDAAHKGYEIFSTMPNLYDCEGDVITTGDTPFPTEGIWWDGELDREMLSAPDGNGFNTMVTKYDQTRLIQMAKESGWTVKSTYGVRPMFFGDIIGDWRDEVILKKGDTSSSTGIIGYTTDYSTDYSIYCLQQDPAYRLQCTTRGYYQSPMTGFYLGYGMPNPPLPPSMVSDVRWGSGSEWNSGGSNFKAYDLSASTSETNGKSVLFDISGSNSSTINITGTQTPKVVYVMSPLGHDYTWNVSGSLSGPMNLWKSMNGTLTVNGNLAYTGKTIVSEGTLQLEGSLTGPLDMRAKGTLSGNAVLNDTTLFEGALNYEGCRLSPGMASSPFGVITSNKNMTLPGNVYIEENLQTEGTVKCDLLKVNGDLTLLGANTFTIVPSETKPNEGEYVLAQCTGTLTADASKIAIRGLVGLNYSVKTDGKQIILKIIGSRAPASGVKWTGDTNNTWDYKTANFSLGGQATTFVANDEITFGDEPSQRTVTIGELMPVAGVTFVHQNGNYTLNGDGGISGTGGLTKTGSGTLYLNNTKSNFTGATILNGGTTVVKELGDAGSESSIGAASAAATNFQLNKCTLTVNNANTSTNRGMTLTDTVNVNVANGYTTLKGVVAGNGTLLKTGTGQLSLTYGTNTYTGGTIVRGGTLAQGSWNTTFGTLGGNLTLAGGTLIVMANNGTSTIPNIQYKLHIADGTTNYINGSYRFRMQGSIDGNGTLTINFPYVRGDVSANWSNFGGTLNATGVQMRLNAAQDMSKATMNLGDATNLGHYATGSGTLLTTLTTKIGALKSTSATSNITGGIFNIGYNNQDATFSGLLNCNAVNKYGTGTWTLTNGASSAPLSIYGGTVCAANASGTLTTGNIIVYSGGTLLGTGITKNVTVQKGGIVDAGTGTLTTGTLTVDGNLTLNAGATLRVRMRTVTNSKYNVSGALTMNNDTLLLDNQGRNYKNGDELTIFTGSGTRQGTYVLKPAVPAEGYVWDDSSLLSDGILRVAATDGIAAIGAQSSVDVYNAGGVLLRSDVQYDKALNNLPHGTYIVKPRGQSATYKINH